MLESKSDKKVEEKSLSSIEFTYKNKPGIFSWLKKLQIDLISVWSIIAITAFTWYTYMWQKSETTALRDVSKQSTMYAESYSLLKKKIEETKWIKVQDFNGQQFVKIFDFLKKTGLDSYSLTESKKEWAYQIVIESYPTAELQKIIEDGFKDGVLDPETKQTFMITKPDLAGVTLIFKNKQ